MTPFRPDTMQDLKARLNAVSDRHMQQAAPNAADPGTPSPAEVLVPLMRRLLPSGSETEATRLAALLVSRVEARMAWHRAEVIRTRLDMTAPATTDRLQADTTELGELLLGLAGSLDAGAALVLLDDAGSDLDRHGLLDSSVPELREAALDAMTPGAMDRFDRLCRHACIAQLSGAISRRPLGALDRASLRQQILEQRPSGGQRLDEGEPAFLDALRRGDHAAATSLLAASALVPRELVAATIAMRSQRGLVSLAWKAGYSMRAAVLLQSQLAGIAPDALLCAGADGGCPLGRGEMVWQIGMLSRAYP